MKNKVNLLLLVVILILGFVLRLYKINEPIADWHSWRQVDTAAVTKFLLEDRELFTPKYNDISRVQTGYENPKGYRFVEFPIFNLIHAVFFKTLPFSFEVAGRLVSILASLVTAIFLYLIGVKIYGKRLGLLSAFFYLTLPFNVYFTRVVLPDPLAVAFGIAAVYFFLSYIEKQKNTYLYLSSMLLSFGLLTKPHAIFFALPMLFLALKKFGLRTFTKTHLYIALDLALIPILLWRGWMSYGDRFTGIPHFEWSFNGNGIRFRPSFWRWIFGERIGKLMLGYWGLIPFGIGMLYRKTSGLIHMFLLTAFLYVSIFASANVMHDYYQIFIMPAVSLAIAQGVVYLTESGFAKRYIALPVLGLVLGIMYSVSFFYIMDNYKINDTQFFQAAKRIDEITPKDALVIAPNNGSTVFLYHTNRKGWPIVTTSIEEMIKMGADYYVSINKNDADTNNFKQKYKILEETDNYIILELNKPI